MRTLLLLLLFATATAFRTPPCTRGGSSSAMLSMAKAPSPKKGSPSKEPETPVATKGSAFTLESLLTLIQMGAGAPSLGKFKEMDSNGKMFFELEANNAYDKDGNSLQTKQRYFERGYVEDKTSSEPKPPGFFENLLSGGRMQTEWEEKIKR